MPKVQVRLDRRLIPSTRSLDSRGSSENQRAAYNAARVLVQECIPDAVVWAMGIVSGRVYSTSEVIVIPEPFHEWAVNTPHVEIVIEPGDIDGTFEERKARRIVIANSAAHELARDLYYANASVHNQLQHRLNETPTFDIECRPISGSGQTVEVAQNASIHILSDWGMK